MIRSMRSCKRMTIEIINDIEVGNDRVEIIHFSDEFGKKMGFMSVKCEET